MTLTRTLPLLAASFAFAASAHAALIAHASFDDLTTGDINGQAGGVGFSGNWTGVAGQAVVTSSLSYSSGSITVNGGSQAIQLTLSSDNLFYRNLSTSYTDDVIYMSMLIRQDAGASTDGDTAQFWLDGVATGNHVTTAAPALGLNGAAGAAALQARVGSISTASSGTYAGANTYFLVGMFQKTVSGASNPYTKATFWLNPGSTLDPASATGATGTGLLSSFGILGLRSNSVNQNAPADTILVDEIRVGTTFADVVPEPSTTLLGTLGLLALLRRRRA